MFLSGELRCFGRAAEGQLGYGNVEDIGDDEPAASGGPVPIGFTASNVFSGSGSFFTCALDGSGALTCWGGSINPGTTGVSFLGYPGQTTNIGDDEAPNSGGVVDVGGVVIELATGAEHTCALLDTGNVRCWGVGSRGRLGYGNTDNIGDDEAPSAAGDVPVGATMTHIATGWYHSCGVTDAGNVRCWGFNNSGQLGYGFTSWIGDTEPASAGGDVDLGGDQIVDVDCGRAHTCALTVNGEVRCWGDNSRGQIGTGVPGTIGDTELPSTISPVDLGGPAVELFVDADTSCALMREGGVRCWGNGGDGRLGYGNLLKLEQTFMGEPHAIDVSPKLLTFLFCVTCAEPLGLCLK